MLFELILSEMGSEAFNGTLSNLVGNFDLLQVAITYRAVDVLVD